MLLRHLLLELSPDVQSWLQTHLDPEISKYLHENTEHASVETRGTAAPAAAAAAAERGLSGVRDAPLNVPRQLSLQLNLFATKARSLPAQSNPSTWEQSVCV